MISIETKSSNVLEKLGTGKGRGNEIAPYLDTFYRNRHKNRQVNALEFLPILFNYNGAPLTLKHHFCMEPLFNGNLRSEFTFMCSRQVGKSMQLCTKSLFNASWRSHWNILFVAPFFETIRRLSSDYFASLIQQSPAQDVFRGPGCVSQVLERTLPNHSRIRFTYAYRSADRARGVHARELVCDEFQLMLPEVMPVLTACMDASPYGDYITRAGTPLTNANHLSVQFAEKSSRSHWCIPCRSCRRESVAALEYDLLTMIGPVHSGISYDCPGIRCPKCKYPLFPWDGYFINLNPEKRNEHVGIHVPSTIMPMHCCSPEKWRDLWKILNDPFMPEFTKFNESLGVPYDDGVTLLSELAIRKVAVLGPNRMDDVLPTLHKYGEKLIIGVDWGGGGLSGESLTKVSLCGLAPDGKIHVLFGMQFTSTASTQQQASIIHFLWKTSKAQFIAHDNLGIGSKCEAMLVEKGVPLATLLPMEYVGETQGVICRRRKATQERPRPAIAVDKTRGLLHLIEAIHSQQVLTFRMEKRFHASDLLLDLTHLRAEERVPVAGVKNATVLIQKEPGMSDDFAHAIHFAANALWSLNGAWPRLSKEILINTPQDLSDYMTDLAGHLDPETIDALLKTADDTPLSTSS